jgi:hypothetical protein
VTPRFVVPALAALALVACASAGARRPPGHEALVNAHMQGNYEQVLRWCPVILEDSGADPAQSDWCLFGYPAALRLALDSEGALGFMRSVCTDLAGHPSGDEAFRVFYVREVARWFALPMRMQKRDATLPRALRSTVNEFSEVCLVDPEAVRVGLDTHLPTRRGG